MGPTGTRRAGRIGASRVGRWASVLVALALVLASVGSPWTAGATIAADPQPQAITFDPPPDATYTDPPVTLSATADSGLTLPSRVVQRSHGCIDTRAS